MDSTVLMQWLQRQGYRVIVGDSCCWYEIRPRVLQAVPFHHLVTLSEAEVAQTLVRTRAMALRYSTPCEAPEGKLSYHVVNANKDYDLAQFSRSTRYDVRRGLKYAGVEPISLSRLASEGWALRAETLARQGRVGAETQAWWQRLCAGAEGLPGFHAWGAVREGKLMASILTCTVDDCCVGLYQQCCAEALTTCVNNALTYFFTKEALSRPQINQVFYGLHSLDADERLDKFKFRMGYVAKPVRQRVVLNRWLRLCVNPLSHAMLRTLRRRWPDRPSLAKVEGMARFYLEGKKPVTEQTWPECLKNQQEAASRCATTAPQSAAESKPAQEEDSMVNRRECA